MTDTDPTRAKLVSQAARLGAARQGIRETRAQIIAKAKEQLDSMIPAIHAAEASVQADSAGILGQRRLRTLQEERIRLERLIGAHENRARDAIDSRTPEDVP